VLDKDDKNSLLLVNELDEEKQIPIIEFSFEAKSFKMIIIWNGK